MTAYSITNIKRKEGEIMKKNTSLFILIIVIVALCAFLGSCQKVCVHTYDNDCDASCNSCGEVREINGHNWENETCTTPRICIICGETEGEPLGHKWNEATCDTPRTCNICGITSGSALGHTSENDDGDCTTAIRCSTCKEVITDGNSSHTPAPDDGDCTTPVECIYCPTVVEDAKSHVFSDIYVLNENEHCQLCTNENCETTSEPIAHSGTGIVGEDGFERCECGYIVADHGHEHNEVVIKSNENGHWYECACGNSATPMVSHESKEDDSDCTTDVLCTVCDYPIISGNYAHVDSDGDGLCDNDGCEKEASNTPSGDEPTDKNDGIDLPMDEND